MNDICKFLNSKSNHGRVTNPGESVEKATPNGINETKVEKEPYFK